MKALADWVRAQQQQQQQVQQVQVIFHVLSLLLAAQYSCSKGPGADSAVYNAICDVQVRAAMLQGVQLLISALDIDHDPHHHHDRAVSAPHPQLHFNKDSDGRRLVGLCSLMLQVRTHTAAVDAMLCYAMTRLLNAMLCYVYNNYCTVLYCATELLYGSHCYSTTEQ